MKSARMWGGPLLWLLIILLWPGLAVQGAVLACAVWMLWWWIGGAVPIGPTSLLPIVLFPATGVMDVAAATAPFGSKFIWLFLGGFVLALAIEKHGLHRRIALHVLSKLGGSPRQILLGLFLSSALLSMWISNTATAIMMLAIATSVIGLIEERSGRIAWSTALLLAVAYGANTGGMATLVGTPPNAALASWASDEAGIDIGFAHWVKLGFPVALAVGSVVLVGLIVLWRVPSAWSDGSLKMKAGIQSELDVLGRMGSTERRVLMLFVGTALFWMSRGALNAGFASLDWGLRLNDTGIAVAAAVLCFVVPMGGDASAGSSSSSPLLKWPDARRLPWDILLLFGGGLALAAGFRVSGWIDVLATGVSSWDVSSAWMVLGLLALALFATELMSNLALTLLLVPVAAEVGVAMGMHPMALAVPVTLAASCAFMLPMATPPNAIVFGSGRISMGAMARSGFVLNLLALITVWAVCQVLLPGWLAGL